MASIKKQNLTQEEVWDIIAPKWNEYRKNPKENVIEFLKNQKGKILDMGSGSGRYLIKTNGKMYLVDFSKEMIGLAKEKSKQKNIPAKFNISILSDLPYKNNFFDAAIFIDSLHCIETKKRRKNAVKELYRVLKPGAKAFVSVWNKNQKRFKNSKKEKLIGWEEKVKRYYYLYDETEIHELFKKIGFEIISKKTPNKKIVFTVKKP